MTYALQVISLVMLFAADTNILLSDNDLNNLHVKSNHELHNLFKWITANKLT